MYINGVSVTNACGTHFSLSLVALSAVHANNILFHDDFEGQPSFPNSFWQIGHFLDKCVRSSCCHLPPLLYHNA